MPVFLGGPAESALGQEVARLAQLPHANLCGRLPLRDVAAVLRGLDLCITPDTGSRTWPIGSACPCSTFP